LSLHRFIAHNSCGHCSSNSGLASNHMFSFRKNTTRPTWQCEELRCTTLPTSSRPLLETVRVRLVWVLPRRGCERECNRVHLELLLKVHVLQWVDGFHDGAVSYPGALSARCRNDLVSVGLVCEFRPDRHAYPMIPKRLDSSNTIVFWAVSGSLKHRNTVWRVLMLGFYRHLHSRCSRG
jgi:hypothetical protein